VTGPTTREFPASFTALDDVPGLPEAFDELTHDTGVMWAQTYWRMSNIQRERYLEYAQAHAGNQPALQTLMWAPGWVVDATWDTSSPEGPWPLGGSAGEVVRAGSTLSCTCEDFGPHQVCEHTVARWLRDPDGLDMP
jgi:hypothetical protein